MFEQSSEGLVTPITKNENGEDVPTGSRTWTYTMNDGSAYVNGCTAPNICYNYHCNDWTTSTTGYGFLGTVYDGRLWSAGYGSRNCAASNRLYCFQQSLPTTPTMTLNPPAIIPPPPQP